jgi:hypothetical protein
MCQKKVWNEWVFSLQSEETVRHANCELEISTMAVWRVLWKRMEMNPYCLHLVQFLKPTDHAKRTNFSIKMQEVMAEDGFLIVFSDDSTFHLSGQVHRHNVCTWGTENPQAIVQHKRASPKINLFCAMSTQKVYGPSSVKTLWRKQVTLKCYRHGFSLNCMKMNQRT